MFPRTDSATLFPRTTSYLVLVIVTWVLMVRPVFVLQYTLQIRYDKVQLFRGKWQLVEIDKKYCIY